MIPYNRDTFQTIEYKNVYIHLCYDRLQGKQIVEFEVSNKHYQCHSLEYAKRTIRKKVADRMKLDYALYKFNEIQEFVEQNKRIPKEDASDLAEARLAVRLRAARANSELVQLLSDHDKLGLLSEVISKL